MKRLTGAVVLAGMAAATFSIAPALAGPTHPRTPPNITPAIKAVAASADSVTQTKTITRTYFNGIHAQTTTATATPTPTDGTSPSTTTTTTYDGTPTSQSNTITVAADRHTNLQSRERIHIVWSGAHPSAGRVPNPYGASGLNQEYPVLVLECRGTPENVTPSSCWTSTYAQRSLGVAQSSAVWLDDAQNSADDKRLVSGIPDADLAKYKTECALQDGVAYHITPFVTADGQTFDGCDASHMPPEAGIGSADPPNEVAAFTALDGTGSVDFEVRTNTENRSLGCSNTTPCTLEVIPIDGLSCADADPVCNSTGDFQPGSSNEGQAPAAAVSPQFWWSPSNWNNRFSIPLTFAPPPNTCSLLGTGAPVPFYGSELLAQTSLQWAPSYCLDKKRFNWQANTMPDDAAMQLMENGGAIAAQPSTQTKGDDGVAYAPTALTGWGIAFNIDKPDNAGQQETLNLNARLIAKLLTESYPGSYLGAKRPGLEQNPLSINLDPEFQKLNPGLDTQSFTEAASTLLALSTGSAIITELTTYMKNDPDAAAFLAGKPDPWGMKVNPAYKGIKLPVETWPLLDTWYPQNTGQECLDSNPAPYLPKVAAPVSSMRLIATAMLLNWPNVNTVCTKDPGTGLFKLGRVDPQGIGNRFMFGLVTLGDAARYGLTVASLQAAPGKYVAPTDAGIKAGVALSTQVPLTKADRSRVHVLPFTLDQTKVRKSGSAYPGTMIVYTAAKMHGLDKTAVKQVKQFIQVSTTEGQKPGRGNGQLADGFVPIVNSGPTKKLYVAARVAMKSITTAKAPKAPTGSTTGPTTPVVSSGPTAASVPVVPPASIGAETTPPASTTPEAAPVAKTKLLSSPVSGGLLPFLLFAGVLAALASAIGRGVLRMRGLR